VARTANAPYASIASRYPEVNSVEGRPTRDLIALTTQTPARTRPPARAIGGIRKESAAPRTKPAPRGHHLARWTSLLPDDIDVSMANLRSMGAGTALQDPLVVLRPPQVARPRHTVRPVPAAIGPSLEAERAQRDGETRSVPPAPASGGISVGSRRISVGSRGKSVGSRGKSVGSRGQMVARTSPTGRPPPRSSYRPSSSITGWWTPERRKAAAITTGRAR
jgi:hypothetical protein